MSAAIAEKAKTLFLIISRISNTLLLILFSMIMNTIAIIIAITIHIHPKEEGSREKPYIKDARAIPYTIDPRQSNFSPTASAHSVFIFLFIRISEIMPKGTRNAKILLHPRYWVSNPPITGPHDKPRYVEVILIPIALPLSPG